MPSTTALTIYSSGTPTQASPEQAPLNSNVMRRKRTGDRKARFKAVRLCGCLRCFSATDSLVY